MHALWPLESSGGQEIISVLKVSSVHYSTGMIWSKPLLKWEVLSSADHVTTALIKKM